MKTNIITVMPTRGLILTEVQNALDAELASCRQIPMILRTYDLSLPVCRNYLIETALKLKNWTHILLLDDDVILPKGGLQELIKLNADISIMDYPIKTIVNGKQIGTVVYDKDKSVAWAGLGVVLIKRKVFEVLKQPWFVMTQYRTERAQNGKIGFFVGQSQEVIQLSGGEDTFFYLQARKEKFSVKVAKKIAQHAYIENMVSPVSNNRYQSQHKIVKRNKIEGRLV